MEYLLGYGYKREINFEFKLDLNEILPFLGMP